VKAMKLSYSIDEVNKLLKAELSEKRYLHSVRVMETCESLAIQYKLDAEKAKIAGLLHDCARELSNDELKQMLNKNSIEINVIESDQPILLHAKASGIYAKEKYGINDEDILSAISCHTTGKANMTKIDIIVFLADYIEPGRKFPGVDEVRNIAYNDIESALTITLKNTIDHVVGRGNIIHPDTERAFNWSLGFKWESIV